MYATVGRHPTSTKEISKRGDVVAYFAELEDAIKQEAGKGANSRLVAIGEIGLGMSLRFGVCASHQADFGNAKDYDRLHHSDADTQRSFFPRLLTLGETYCLPLFLHSRHPEAHTDLVKTLRSAGWKEGLAPEDGADGLEGLVKGRSGVVHSFTGTVEEMKELVSSGFILNAPLSTCC